MNFYIVSNKPNVLKSVMENKEDDVIVYTIVRKLKDCTEYVNKFIKMKNFTHYLNWCNAHSLNPEDGLSWGKYSSTVVRDQFKDFYMTKFKFNSKLIGACLRLLNGCVPVGASYELPMEISAFVKNNCDEEELQALKEDIKGLEDSLRQL